MTSLSKPKIAIFNQKGGTAKTTTSIHLAAALARRKKSVLLVDADPQGSVAVSLRKLPSGLKELLFSELTFKEAAQKVTDHFQLLAGGKDLLSVETALHRESLQRERLFSNRMGSLHYDFIIFDMAPSRSLLNEAALFFVDELLVPVSCDYLSLVGVRDILQFIEKINAKRDTDISLRGIVPTLFDTRSRISSESCKLLEKHFPGKIMTAIRQSTKAKEAPSFGKTLFDYAPRSTTARDYQELSAHFINALHQ